MARPERRTPLTSARYLTEIREFLAKCGASVRTKRKPKKLRDTDSFITDNLLSSNMSTRKIDMSNKVRLHLQVETIAEISNPEGTKIDPAWLGDNKKPSWSTALWPKVRKPSEKMWKAWRSAVKSLTHDGSHLRRKLGKWRKIPEQKIPMDARWRVGFCQQRRNKETSHKRKTKEKMNHRLKVLTC